MRRKTRPNNATHNKSKQHIPKQSRPKRNEQCKAMHCKANQSKPKQSKATQFAVNNFVWRCLTRAKHATRQRCRYSLSKRKLGATCATSTAGSHRGHLRSLSLRTGLNLPQLAASLSVLQAPTQTGLTRLCFRVW